MFYFYREISSVFMVEVTDEIKMICTNGTSSATIVIQHTIAKVGVLLYSLKNN